jgi:alpha(1,3/1,4) fucosyltransferase
MSKPIKINFTDFWTENLNDIWLYNILSKYFQLEISEEPDVLIYSVFGSKHLNYRCKKIYFTTENTLPDYRFCDYSIGFNYDEANENHIRYPLFLFYSDVNLLVRTKPFTAEDLEQKKKFCLFVVSNDAATERISFFKMLNEVKPYARQLAHTCW